VSEKAFNALGLLLIGSYILFRVVKVLRGKSWEHNLTPLDRERMRRKWYYWPSAAIPGILIALMTILICFSAFVLWSEL